MTADTLLFSLMMLSIGLYVESSEFWRIAIAVSSPLVALVWILFLLIIGVFAFFPNNVINSWLEIKIALPVFRPFIWMTATIDGNVKWLTLLGCTLVGIALIISGIDKRRKG